MDKQTVLLTGAAGLLGRYICRAFADTYSVVGLDIRDPEPTVDGVDYIKLDLTSDDSVKNALEQVRKKSGTDIVSVLHFAAYHDFTGAPSPLYDEVNVRGTARLLKQLREFSVEQFVYASSMLVHKPTEPGHAISEDDPLEAKWDYPASKINAEEVVRKLRDDIPAVILRIAGVYTDECDLLPVSQQIRRIAEQDITSHVYPGDIWHGQSYVHMDDVIDAVRRVIERRGDLGPEETFLIGEPVTYSYEEIQRALGRLIHDDTDWKTREIPKALARSGAKVRDSVTGRGHEFIKPWMIDLADDHYELNIAKAGEKLDWHPRCTFMQTLPKMVEALRRDPDAWYRRHELGPAPRDLQLTPVR